MYAVTGATGQLGRLTIQALLKTVPAAQIVAGVRDPAKAADLAAQGVLVREADYDRPETLPGAFNGVDKLLIISGTDVGRRTPQHRAAIEAAAKAGVGLVGYTSVLRADGSKLGVADEHREAEAILKASGAPWVLLRNGWYTENYVGWIPSAVQTGALLGAAAGGRISAATRADYAAAAAAVLTSSTVQAGRTYELAGDDAFTMAELAAEIARQAGVPVAYQDMPEAAFQETLMKIGLPEPLAVMLARSDAAAAEGDLFDSGRQLSSLIGRPTTPLADVVAAALKG